jgi:hypothetical protein
VWEQPCQKGEENKGRRYIKHMYSGRTSWMYLCTYPDFSKKGVYEVTEVSKKLLLSY